MSDQPGQNSEPGPSDPSSAPPPPPPPPPATPPPAEPPATASPAEGTAPPPPAPAYGAPPPAAPAGGAQPPSYGAPPPAPGYQQPPPGYQQPPPGYQQAPAGYGAPGTDPALPYANWGNRVIGALIDYVVPGIIADVFLQINRPLGLIVWLAALVWTIYNKVIEGQTGQSYGKKVAGTRTVSATTGQPIGGGMAVVRWIAHIIDAIPCLLGYLWPLWDAKRQTFSDKIIGTYVLKV